ncbi:MAG: ABC transporter ATP-binding protein [Coxiella sp. (in: Bacteria)]|nr:MAG: ABC transporter ATP-binding protein [Coxiella sp. (in: g-proteobacteria)]
MKGIEVENVTVEIPVFDPSRSFRGTLGAMLGGKIHSRGNSKKVFVQALEDINFSLKEGDRLGLIGGNGAGKTTLLNILAGVYLPHRGSVRVTGKIMPLFNISLGLDIDNTGFENINTMGMYHGLSKKTINERREEIIEFTELGDFIHLPARTYSAGMLLRLSFAIVTTLLEPDILLLDEGIGVGDAIFAKKSEERLKSFYKKLSILVMASHSNDLIKNMCNKAMLLDHGRIIKYGPVDEVLDYYKDFINAAQKTVLAPVPLEVCTV